MPGEFIHRNSFTTQGLSQFVGVGALERKAGRKPVADAEDGTDGSIGWKVPHGFIDQLRKLAVDERSNSGKAIGT